MDQEWDGFGRVPLPHDDSLSPPPSPRLEKAPVLGFAHFGLPDLALTLTVTNEPAASSPAQGTTGTSARRASPASAARVSAIRARFTHCAELEFSDSDSDSNNHDNINGVLGGISGLDRGEDTTLPSSDASAASDASLSPRTHSHARSARVSSAGGTSLAAARSAAGAAALSAQVLSALNAGAAARARCEGRVRALQRKLVATRAVARSAMDRAWERLAAAQAEARTAKQDNVLLRERVSALSQQTTAQQQELATLANAAAEARGEAVAAADGIVAAAAARAHAEAAAALYQKALGEESALVQELRARLSAARSDASEAASGHQLQRTGLEADLAQSREALTAQVAQLRAAAATHETALAAARAEGLEEGRARGRDEGERGGRAAGAAAAFEQGRLVGAAEGETRGLAAAEALAAKRVAAAVAAAAAAAAAETDGERERLTRELALARARVTELEAATAGAETRAAEVRAALERREAEERVRRISEQRREQEQLLQAQQEQLQRQGALLEQAGKDAAAAAAGAKAAAEAAAAELAATAERNRLQQQAAADAANYDDVDEDDEDEGARCRPGTYPNTVPPMVPGMYAPLPLTPVPFAGAALANNAALPPLSRPLSAVNTGHGNGNGSRGGTPRKAVVMPAASVVANADPGLAGVDSLLRAARVRCKEILRDTQRLEATGVAGQRERERASSQSRATMISVSRAAAESDTAVQFPRLEAWARALQSGSTSAEQSALFIPGRASPRDYDRYRSTSVGEAADDSAVDNVDAPEPESARGRSRDPLSRGSSRASSRGGDDLNDSTYRIYGGNGTFNPLSPNDSNHAWPHEGARRRGDIKMETAIRARPGIFDNGLAVHMNH